MLNGEAKVENNLEILQDNVNQLEIRFGKLREDVISKLNECSDCIKSAKKICQQATEMNNDLEKKSGSGAGVSNGEKELKSTKMMFSTTLIKGKIILDVGGEKFVTSVDTLTRKKDSFFTILFSKPWELEKDPQDNSIFIDRNGKLFSYILEYLRTDFISSNIMKDEVLLHSLLIEAEYFGLNSLSDILTGFANITLFQPEYKKKINEFYGKTTQQWELIYKASRDGFGASSFHSRCDNKGPTLTIIQSSNNFLFGGYTSISWTLDNGSYRNDRTAFLFTLTNPHGIPPTKYVLHPSNRENAVYHKSDRGPTFGGGYDLYLANKGNSNRSSYTNFPTSYMDTTGKGKSTFTGAENFTVADIEVFKLA